MVSENVVECVWSTEQVYGNNIHFRFLFCFLNLSHTILYRLSVTLTASSCFFQLEFGAGPAAARALVHVVFHGSRNREGISSQSRADVWTQCGLPAYCAVLQCHQSGNNHSKVRKESER